MSNKIPEHKKIAFGDNLKVRFSVVRKVFYTFLHHKKGVALIVVLGTLLIVAILAGVITNLILSQARFSHHHLSRMRAYYVAQAGINYAIDRLSNSTSGWVIPNSGSTTKKMICKEEVSGPQCDVESELPYNVTVKIYPKDSVPLSGGGQAINGTAPLSATVDYTYTEP